MSQITSITRLTSGELPGFWPFQRTVQFSGTSTTITDNNILASSEMDQLSLRDLETGNRSSTLSWVRAASKTSVSRAFHRGMCMRLCVCEQSCCKWTKRITLAFSLGRVTDWLCPAQLTADHQDVGTYLQERMRPYDIHVALPPVCSPQDLRF